MFIAARKPLTYMENLLSRNSMVLLWRRWLICRSQQLISLEMDIFPPSEQTPASLGLLVKLDIEKWWAIIKAAGIKDQ
jgi:hypothetical protein